MPLGRVATAQQLLHDLVHRFIARMGVLEGFPAIDEDLLEAIFVDLTWVRHAQQGSAQKLLCQTRAGKKGNSYGMNGYSTGNPTRDKRLLAEYDRKSGRWDYLI